MGWLSAITYQTLHHTVSLIEPVKFEVKKGSSFRQIAKELTDHGLMINPRLVELILRVRGQAAQVKAGEYVFSGRVSVAEVLQQLRDGVVVQYQMTLVEGHTLKQWLTALQEHPKIASKLSHDNLEPLRQALGQGRQNLEGLFFPDTYSFEAGTTDLALLIRAYEMMSEKLARVWEGREAGLPYSTPYDLLIMASIVEKETGLPEERARIAGVFVSRLRKKMRLQTDPTVIYGLGDAFDGDLKRVHLRTHTPYNTYVIRGLPPTPIAMVGIEALEAAAKPDVTGELYFVATGDGGHVFSRTLEAHNEAVRRFQLRR